MSRETCLTGTNNSRFLFKPFLFFDRSSDAKYLAVSSRDCFCTIIEFENEELGLPYNLSGISLSSIFLFFGCVYLNFVEWKIYVSIQNWIIILLG